MPLEQRPAERRIARRKTRFQRFIKRLIGDHVHSSNPK